MIEALCIGHAAWDISVWMPEFPAENSKYEVRTLVECSGGPAANAAYLLAQWGVRSAFLGVLGNDSVGDRIRASLAGAGVEISGVLSSDRCMTPVSVVLVNECTGSRTILNRSTPAEERPTLDLSSLNSTTPPRLLLFDGHELEASLEAMERFPAAITVLDAGSLRKGTQTLAERVHYLVASERFARQLADLPPLDTPNLWVQALAALHERNGRPVVITLGERGLVYGSGDDCVHLPAYPARPVDTTGAGDIFHGAFAYGLLRNFKWEKTLKLAAMAAALSTCERGSSLSVPALEKVEEALGGG